MLKITNSKVYDLEESIVSCRNAMRLEAPAYTKEDFEKGLERAKKLCKASADSPNVKCHDNFLTGIRVSFDLTYTQYITKQFQRYHWFDYVSSSSMMHRITKMDFSKCVNKYVTTEMREQMQKYVNFYNYVVDNKIEEWGFVLGNGETIYTNTLQETTYIAFMIVISNCPMGTELFTRVSTNYKQLQTMYHQRKNHKLKEDWGNFCEFVESLPYAKEFILCEPSTETTK